MIRNNPEAAIAMGRTMTEILYDHMDKGLREIDNPTFGLTWSLGEHRLGDSCKSQVLTIKHFEIRRANSKRLVVKTFIETIIRGRQPMPRKPIAFLHFWAPPFNLKGVLMQLHFNPYQIGQRFDFWHVIDGQGELL